MTYIETDPEHALTEKLTQLVGLDKTTRILERVEEFSSIDDKIQLITACLQHYAGDRALDHYLKWRTKEGPVSPEEFLYSPDYMAVPEDELWPPVRDAIIEINSGEYIEAVLTGGIGVAKTTIALYTQAYQLYLLSMYQSPHYELGIAPTDEILFVFQNMSATLSKVVDYERFKGMIDRSTYFPTHFPYDKSLKSELRFPHRICVRPLSGQMTAAIGQNVFSGLIDEVNFMAVVEKSKQARDGTTFDQAMSIYNTINMRRKSRFLSQGTLPGVLCMVSSRNYPGQFTDKKEEERLEDIKTYGKSGIYLYDKVLWEVKPKDFSGKMFALFLGDASSNPRIVPPEEYTKMSAAQKATLMLIPVEFLREFQSDLMNSIRDIAGKSTLAKHPYLVNAEAVGNAMGRCKSVFSRWDTDFVNTQLQLLLKNIVNPEIPRWVHLDLALSGDAAGLAIGHVPGFKEVARGLEGVPETLPRFHFDGVLKISHAPGKEIPLDRIRAIVYKLVECGMTIRWVSADQFQSADTLQIMANQGFSVGRVSVDSTIEPYAFVKGAIYDGRLALPECPLLLTELLSLEYDAKKVKVDHPPNGSKDIADAVAGVVWGLTMSREVWAMHNVTPGEGLLSRVAEEKTKRERETERKRLDSYYEGDGHPG